ncbi:LamG-like jellyroll fold domain-containing protein [Streptomyces sp. NBC_00094]|uniref:LamG-like jellyroll fold domain-containing protein n=1 Tax=Streptomyces sp. NBC_00094 TaxID=2903620 RepID=UPI0022528C9B|nr:LamG-like jellyroll fold domain-containing protein [Streptomyces sp. NBC_00094]MCX5395343.1 DNRLRE domain-containing protein [Streptomyces sp. NBC_00094]
MTAPPDTPPVTEEAALAQARRTGEKVEVLALRGESREVFATPAGTLEAREHLRPVRTRVDGQWQDIDTTLATTDAGVVSPRTAAVGLEFSAGGEGPLVRLERTGRTLELSWPGQVPAPELSGDTATYVNLLPDVDLRLAARPEGFTQLLVVKSAQGAKNPALATLRMGLAAEGMAVRETEQGGLQATDTGSGGTVFEAATPMMWDSSDGPAQLPVTSAPAQRTTVADEPGAGTQQSTDPEPGAAESGRLAPLDVELTDGGNELLLTPDPEVLAGADTEYPVYIDPQWYSPKATAWTMASKYWASSPQWKFNGEPDAGLGYCGWAYCMPHDTKRLFYQLPTTTYAGKTVLSAEFVVRNTWSASCSPRTVELWKTKGISSSTTWNSQDNDEFWIDRLANPSFAYGYEGCGDRDAEFDVKAAVQQAANNSASTITFGLRAASETDPYAWKRFSDDAYLRVQYNRPPGQIKTSQLTQDPGGACGSPSNPKRVRSVPKLTVNGVTDPDKDSVSVQFNAAWDSGDGKGFVTRWTSTRTTAKASGSSFTVAMPSTIPQNRTIGWSARSWDGAQWSPWSSAGSATTCSMVYDATVPSGPVISSPHYPQSNPEDPNDPWVDGVGRYGSFSMDSGSGDVVKYWYGINGDPSAKLSVTTSGGAARTVKTMPTKPGVNFLTAQAFDAAGNGSEIRTFQFRVRSGQPDRLSWPLDESNGAAKATGRGGDWPATLYGGAGTGAPGASGTALELDGTDDYAASDAPVLNTAKSFSVSVWAKPTSVRPEFGSVAVAQTGLNRSAFELYFSPSRHGWVFVRHETDTPHPAAAQAMQPACAATDTQCAASRLNRWTHVTGVFENTPKIMRLYVDGKLVGTAPFDGPWDARGRTMIGATSVGDALNSFFTGSLDDVQLFDYPLSDSQVGRLATKQPVDTGRPAKLVWPMDEAPQASEVIGTAQQVDAELRGGATAGALGIAGRALKLDGADDYATSGRPVLDTFQSFAVSAWVKLPKDKENRTMVAVAQSGQTGRGFELYHSSAWGGWVFSRHHGDQPGAAVTRATQSDCPNTANCIGSWTHLVAVNDYDTSEIRLYINGALADTQPFTTPWAATGPVTLGALPASTGTLNHLKGEVDAVRLYDRAVSGDEVRQLFKQNPTVTGRWKFRADEGTNASTPNDVVSANPLGLKNGAKTTGGWVDGGLTLDGVDDHAISSATPVDTSFGFSVTGWFQASAAPSAPTTVLSVPGSRRDAFTVRYLPDPGGAGPGSWRIITATSDGTTAEQTTVANRQFFTPTEWTHLALVYDGFARRLSLYVNGELEQTTCADDDADGTPDDPDCEVSVSWAENTLTYKAVEPLWVGRAKSGTDRPWSGLVSDLWTFQGSLSDTQVAFLALGQPDMPSTVPLG